jgi:peptidoglycan/xylan/chitin deacetylase (PgdA/CDA1 family)
MSKHGAPRSKRVISRRVLLAAGGLVILGEYVAGQTSAARHLTGSATSRASGPTPHPDTPSPAPRSGGAPAAANATGNNPATQAAQAPPTHTATPADASTGPTHEALARQPATTHQATHPATDPARPHPDDPRATHPAGHPAGDEPPQPMFFLDDGPKVIALTIDDGPDPVYTPQVLALLARYRVTATFSMIGESVADDPALAREVAAAGHQIVNHTWTHADLTRLTPGAVNSQMTRANDMIASATGRRPVMFRAPYGAWSPAVLERCEKLKLAPLDWSVDPRDWARPGVRSIVSTIMRTTRSGSIILEHDGGGDRSQTVAALGIALPRLLDAGYRFRTP